MRDVDDGSTTSSLGYVTAKRLSNIQDSISFDAKNVQEKNGHHTVRRHWSHLNEQKKVLVFRVCDIGVISVGIKWKGKNTQ